MILENIQKLKGIYDEDFMSAHFMFCFFWIMLLILLHYQNHLLRDETGFIL
jgi:hypothetical protein